MGIKLGSSEASVSFIADGASVDVVVLDVGVGMVVMVGTTVVSFVLIDGAGIMDGTGDTDCIVVGIAMDGSFVGPGDTDCIVVGIAMDGSFVGPPLLIESGDSVTPPPTGGMVGLTCPNGTVELFDPPSGVRDTVGSIVVEIVSGADVVVILGTVGIVGDIAVAGALLLDMVGTVGSCIPVGTFTVVGTDGAMMVDGIFAVGMLTACGALVTTGAGVIAVRVGGSSSCRSKIRSCTSSSVSAHIKR